MIGLAECLKHLSAVWSCHTWIQGCCKEGGRWAKPFAAWQRGFGARRAATHKVPNISGPLPTPRFHSALPLPTPHPKPLSIKPPAKALLTW